MENYYDIIGINSDASGAEIKENITAEINKWRKRVNAPNPQKQREASERLEKIQEAEEILMNPGKRKAYDQELMQQQNTPQNNQQTQPVANETVGQSYLDELNNRYEFYSNEKNHFEAGIVCKELTQLTPDDAMVWRNLAYSNFMLGNFAESRYEINKAISLNPNHAHFYYTAYFFYVRSKDLNNRDKIKHTRDYIDKALRIKPNHQLYNFVSARLYFEKGNYQQAIDILERFKENEDFDSGRDLLASCYVRKVQNEHTTIVNYRNGSSKFYFTSREMIAQAKDILKNTLTISQEPDVRDSVLEMNSLADEALKFQYNFKFLILLVICAFWFWNALGSFSIIQLAISGAIVYFSWKKFRVPVYVKHQKYISTLNKN